MEKNHMDNLYKSSNYFVKYFHNKRLLKIINLIPKKKKLKILDAGCGEGHLLKMINHNQKKHSLYGVDITPIAVKSAKLRLPLATISNECLDSLSFSSNYFDIVICTEVIEHIPDYHKALNELQRVLKKDGLLIISFPNEPICILLRLLFFRKPFIKDHYNWFSPRKISKCIRSQYHKKVNLPFNLPWFISLINILVFKK
tara:strand:- start:137 stop:736 length:600 start_codon:yes stop_codon:yes gene_type:complete